MLVSGEPILPFWISEGKRGEVTARGIAFREERSTARRDRGCVGDYPILPFMTRRRKCGQMRGRRPENRGRIYWNTLKGFSQVEDDADGGESFASVERPMSDRPLERQIVIGTEYPWASNQVQIPD